MKIAIPVDQNGMLDIHFGHCRKFVIIDVKDNKIYSEDSIIPPPHEPGLLPRWLSGKGVTDIIADGMGRRALQIFKQEGINVLVGAPSLKAWDLVEGHLNGSLKLEANYCDH
jgi:predicted Fe-Mo cluster-binding NifX family protein